MLAAYHYNTSTEHTVKMLIDHGANVNRINKFGLSTIHQTMHNLNNANESRKNTNVVKLLIDAGAYLNHKTNKVLAPLNTVSTYITDISLQNELIKLLVKADALPQCGWKRNEETDMIDPYIMEYIIKNHFSPPYQYIDLPLLLKLKVICFLKNLRVLPLIIKNTQNGQYLYDLCLKVKNNKPFHVYLSDKLRLKIKRDLADIDIISQINSEIVYASGELLYNPNSLNAKLAKEHFNSLICN
jgi:ankyrin repeat protein